jgi:hypothetical protein
MPDTHEEKTGPSERAKAESWVLVALDFTAQDVHLRKLEADLLREVDNLPRALMADGLGKAYQGSL